MIDSTIAGKRFGFLVTAYSRGHGHAACRCVCGRLVHVAAIDLMDGVITSCGCMPRPRKYWKRNAELRAQQRREIGFQIARSVT